MTDIDPAVVRRIADMHAVYRMFDGASRLLYIGITGRAGRFDEHAVKRWFPLVDSITLEWHATRAQAKLAETRAIAAERPRYNIAGAGSMPKGAAARLAVAQIAPQDAILPDVLAIFQDAKGLHWQMVADRLAKKYPRRWRGVTAATVSALMRSLGVPGVQVKAAGMNRHGCRKDDVERVAAEQIMTARAS